MLSERSVAPSELLLSLFVPGIPQPQGSKDVHHKDGRSWVSESNKRLPLWRQAVTEAAARKHGNRPALGDALRVDATFMFPRPMYHFGKRGLLPSAPLAHTVKPDVDKLVRALLDSLAAAGVMRSDAQVCELGHVVKVYADRPGARIELRRCDPAESTREVAMQEELL